jgi:hypothetical protein
VEPLGAAAMEKLSPALVMVWLRAVDVLVVLEASPEYTPVMVCEPAARAEVVKAACPAAFSATVESTVAPSRKSTVPVGVPAGLLTVAVKVTACPAPAGFSEEAMDVVEAALLMVCVTAVDVLPAKVASPW